MALRTSERIKTPGNAMGRSKSVRMAASSVPAIALDLKPLLAPFRQHGRLSLRFEHLPAYARLSRGRNNGDRSWSLSQDEVENLEYLPAEGMTEPHELSCRVVALEQDGATLAMLDIPVAPVGGFPSSSIETSPSFEHSPVAPSQFNRAEIEALTARLAARDAELANLRATSQGDLQRQLAAANALSAQVLERKRQEWLAEHATEIAAVEERAAHRQDEMRTQLQRDAADTLSRAEATWRAGETSRMLVAEQRAKDDAARAALVAARTQSLEAELARARADLAGKCDPADLQRLQQALNAAQNKAKQQDAELSELRAQIAKGDGGESERLRAELASKCDRADLQNAQTALDAARAEAAQRDAELAALRAQIAKGDGGESERLRAELAGKCDAADLRRAHDALEATKAELARSIAALTEERARAGENDAGDSVNLRSDLAAAQAALTARDTGMAAAEKKFADAQQHWQNQSQDALAKAKADWEKDTIARLAKADIVARAQWEGALEEIEQRARDAEAALAQTRSKNQKSDQRQAELDAAALRVQLVDLQAKLAEREMQLGEAKLAVRETELHSPNAKIILHSDREGSTPKELNAQLARSRHIVFDLVLVAIVGALAILFLPRIEMFLPDSWTTGIDEATSSVTSLITGAVPQNKPAPQAVPTPAAPVVLPQATIIRSVKLHVGPEVGAHVMTTAPRGASVRVVRQQGNWDLIAIDGKDGKTQQGWAYNTYLKAAVSAPHGK